MDERLDALPEALRVVKDALPEALRVVKDENNSNNTEDVYLV